MQMLQREAQGCDHDGLRAVDEGGSESEKMIDLHREEKHYLGSSTPKLLQACARRGEKGWEGRNVHASVASLTSSAVLQGDAAAFRMISGCRTET
jgi:hypothetical protein